MQVELHILVGILGVVALVVAGVRTFQMYEKTEWFNHPCPRERQEISLWLTLCVACLVAFVLGFLSKHF